MRLFLKDLEWQLVDFHSKLSLLQEQYSMFNPEPMYINKMALHLIL